MLFSGKGPLDTLGDELSGMLMMKRISKIIFLANFWLLNSATWIFGGWEKRREKKLSKEKENESCFHFSSFHESMSLSSLEQVHSIIYSPPPFLHLPSSTFIFLITWRVKMYPDCYVMQLKASSFTYNHRLQSSSSSLPLHHHVHGSGHFLTWDVVSIFIIPSTASRIPFLLPSIRWFIHSFSFNLTIELCNVIKL